jgi:hypothetical protein
MCQVAFKNSDVDELLARSHFLVSVPWLKKNAVMFSGHGTDDSDLQMAAGPSAWGEEVTPMDTI